MLGEPSSGACNSRDLLRLVLKGDDAIKEEPAVKASNKERKLAKQPSSSKVTFAPPGGADGLMQA